MKILRHFDLKTLDDFVEYLNLQGIEIPVSKNTEILKRPVNAAGRTILNALGTHPLEGFDGKPDGGPDDLLYRRYRRCGAGGASLIWFEACAVVGEGRSNPRQLMIKRENADKFKELLEAAFKSARDSRGENFKPYTVLQLTHSGRVSKDQDWNSRPMAAVYNPNSDRNPPVKPTYVTDEYLEKLEDEYVRCAGLAAEAGFDAVDVKACHGYLLNELLSAFARDGKYGGSFENRTRCLLNIIRKIKGRLNDKIDIAVRLNAYDGMPYPYGWGMAESGEMRPDGREMLKLVSLLRDNGVKILNITTNGPHFLPFGEGVHIRGNKDAVVDPFKGVAHLLKVTKKIKETVPGVAVMATGLSWFGEFGANVAAGGVKEGWFDIAGFGRQALAYRGFAADILDKGKLDRYKCCTACDRCFAILDGRGRSGCIVRDAEMYMPIFRKHVLGMA